MGPRWSPLCDRVTCALPTSNRVPQGPENQSRLDSRRTDGVLCLDAVRPLSVNCALNSARFAERQYAGERAVVWLDRAGRDQGASIYVRQDDGSGEADVAASHVLIGWLEALSWARTWLYCSFQRSATSGWSSLMHRKGQGLYCSWVCVYTYIQRSSWVQCAHEIMWTY